MPRQCNTKMPTIECVSPVLNEDDYDRICLASVKRRCQRQNVPCGRLTMMTTTQCVSTVYDEDDNDRKCLGGVKRI